MPMAITAKPAQKRRETIKDIIQVNVSVDNLGACKQLMRITVEQSVVDAKLDEVAKAFRRQAKIPGFRPGKAPAHLIAKAYQEQIDEETKKQLISDHYEKALKEQNLKPALRPDVEEVQFERGSDFEFVVNIETEPEFTLPEYKKLPIKREIRTVTEDDVARAIDVLRDQHATFTDVERPLASGDFAVINYKGSVDGKPITEVAPDALSLAEKEGFWIPLDKDAFLPGFSDQLQGAGKGDKKTVEIDFPTDFPFKELAEKKGSFDVEITDVKEKVLPEFDDTFAKEKYEAESVDLLTEGIRNDLSNDLQYRQKQSIRQQITQGLLSKVDFDVPETILKAETRQVVTEMVRTNQERGVTKEAIDENKDEIFNAAAANAKDRVKLAFLFEKVAEAEEIKVSKDEITAYIRNAGAAEGITYEKALKRIQDRNAIGQIYESILREKVLDFLELSAEIEDVLPSAS